MSLRERDPIASVVIPAHNEASVIRRCLLALQADGLALDVVVVANACTDDTAAIARGFPGVRVIETPTASKVAALNLGDSLARAFPRIYLDADIELQDDAVSAMVEALATSQPRVAAPQVSFRTTGARRPVRLYYRVFTHLPYTRQALVGLGVYGVSAAGRRRFGDFPRIQADDTFVQRLFADHERATVPGTFVVQVPRDLRSLVRVRTRIAAGNAALARHPDLATGTAAFAGTTRSTVASLLRLVTARPSLLPAAMVYAAVTALARLLARRTSCDTWHRDETSR